MEGPADNPNKRKKTDSATDTQDLLSSEFSVLESINKKLEVLGMLHQEIKDLKVSLEFTYQQISDLQQNNAELRSTLATVTSDVDLLKKENKLLKETVLDVQSRSMRDNLIISGIPESTPDNPEVQVKKFMVTALKIPTETVNNITFHRVHRLGPRGGQRPRPIIAKFEHYQQKMLVKSKGRELKGTSFGWHISSCLLRQYHYVADPKTWTEAQAYCREKYTDLATIHNTTEMNQLADTVSSSGYNSDVWIGLYSVVDWRWSDGYRGSGAEYRNWQNRTDNEPDFSSFHQFCVNIGSAGGWWDDSCSISYPFICYRGTQLEPQFVLVPNGKNWSDAQRHCRENFIDLATVRSGTENQEIHNLVPSNAWVWIGLSRDPNMYWSDGSGYTYSFLSTGSIDISSTSVICGTAQQKSGKLRHCESRFPFVCYSIPPPPPVMRQVVKLRIEPDDPFVDLNDPAVKANILKKLQDRLKEKGMSGVTLKWREQPDGKVFHKEKKSSRKKTEL